MKLRLSSDDQKTIVDFECGSGAAFRGKLYHALTEMVWLTEGGWYDIYILNLNSCDYYSYCDQQNVRWSTSEYLSLRCFFNKRYLDKVWSEMRSLESLIHRQQWSSYW